VGYVMMEVGMVFGWYYYGDYESYIYVLFGVMCMEFGLGGGDVVEVGLGDFIFVLLYIVYCESNFLFENFMVVVVCVGSGELVVNVDGLDVVVDVG